MFRNFLLAFSSLVLIFGYSAFAQPPQPRVAEGTPSQRLEVMRQKLDTMRRSLSSAQTGIKKDGDGKDDKAAADTPLVRLKGLQKETESLISSVSNIRGKIERSEKYDQNELDTLESSATELQKRVDDLLLETASARKSDYTVGAAREKKKKKKFLGILGGGTDKYEELLGTTAPGRDRELFVEGTKNVRKKNFEVGRLLFQTIITTYPDSPYLPMSKLAIADSFYLEGGTSSMIQAAAGYQEWLTFFPLHPLADRVALKVAEANMRQVGRPDRDPTQAYKAEQRLKLMIQQYPRTALKDLAQTRLNEIQDNLGLHNLWIGDFYYSRAIEQQRSGLKGAENRYKEVLAKYPNFAYKDRAIFKLAVLYQTEEETDEAAKLYQQLTRDYPNSDYADKAKEQLQLLGASVPEPSKEGLERQPPKEKSFTSNFIGEALGTWQMTIDKDGVLMSRSFDDSKFELIDSVILNQGDLPSNQIPKSLTTVIRDATPAEQGKTNTDKPNDKTNKEK